MNQEYPDVRFPGWKVVRKLGQGSFGGVYEIQRTLPDGRVERGALKKLSVPHDREEIEEMLSNSFSTESITAHYKDQMGDLVREYSLMQELGSCGNVVTCHDIQYVQQEGGLGWDVYIRMDLLRPLKKTLGQEYREETVLKLGLDLCNALKACQKKNIIHRDIKPENILVSEDGTFKLTDFGIAKVSEKTGSGTLAGTNAYMAPEVANRQHYGASADQYSLGMVLYWMMNKRTLPFLPLPPEIPTANQRQDAVNRRFNGEPLPPPVHGSSELKQVVQRACAFSPAHRYQSIQEFSAALEACCDVQTAETNEETVQPEEISTAEKAPTVSTDETDENTISLNGLLLDTQPDKVREAVKEGEYASAQQQTMGKEEYVDPKTIQIEQIKNKNKSHKNRWIIAAIITVALCGFSYWINIVKPARDSNFWVYIYYHSNGGQGGPYMQRSAVYDHELTFTHPTVIPHREGYKFIGWLYENSNDYEVDMPGQVSSWEEMYKDEGTFLHYYAQWAPAIGGDQKSAREPDFWVNVYYYSNGGQGGPYMQRCAVYDHELTFTHPTVIPHREGYKFIGWLYENSNDYEADMPGQVSSWEEMYEDEGTFLHYYAQWAPAEGG